METLLNTHKIKNIRIKAIDGLNLKDLELDSMCIQSSKLSAPENACTCSHLKTLKYFVENMDVDKVIIFEDDISFEFLNLIPFNWSELEKNFPENYDIIQLAISHEKGTINSTLIKTNPTTKYFCSAAYLITKKAAIKLLERYYSKELNKIDLSSQKYVTADAMISSTDNTYSIPIFTYQTVESTIHPMHIYNHSRSKKQQYMLWKNIMDNIKSFNLSEYFSKFEKN